MNKSLHPKVWLSWSSGKDSYAALYALRTEGQFVIDSAFTVVDVKTERIPMHAVSIDLLVQQVKAVGLEHRLVSLDDEDRVGGIQTLIDDAQTSSVRFFAFGDLFLEDVRYTREQKMLGTGIQTLFPLWQRPTKELLVDLIKGGMRAVITSVDLTVLPVSFLGHELTVELVKELVRHGCDPCGENGEYHSFVFDGPLFEYQVCFKRGEPSVGTDFAHLPLLPIDNTSSVDRMCSNLSNNGFTIVRPFA